MIFVVVDERSVKDWEVDFARERFAIIDFDAGCAAPLDQGTKQQPRVNWLWSART